MTAAPPQIEKITLDKALLWRGIFAAAEGQFLPWQAYCPPPPAIIAGAAAAERGAKPRGTVIALNDWGQSFAANAALPAALAARNFITVSYCWFCAPQQQKQLTVKRRYAAGFNHAALAAFLRQIVLPDYPAPFYLLAQGYSALFALSALPLLSSAISRMIAIAPSFRPGGHAPRGLWHWAAKMLHSFSAADYADAAAAQAGFAWGAAALNQAVLTLSPRFCRAAHLPCLIISAAQDSPFNRSKALYLAETMRLADTLTLSAKPDFLQRGPAQAQQQFWAAFDAFIPGSDTAAHNEQLEYARLI